MTADENDETFLRLYRASASEGPDAAMDRRVLEAVRAAHTNKRSLPLVLAAAACLLVVFYAGLPRRPSPPPPPSVSTATFGLYEGRTAEILGDAEAMRQMTIRQMPGGAN